MRALIIQDAAVKQLLNDKLVASKAKANEIFSRLCVDDMTDEQKIRTIVDAVYSHCQGNVLDWLKEQGWVVER